ncbi:TIGR03960 family B12-binding radical SAM protein [Thermodesulfobacteriota bacterium]
MTLLDQNSLLKIRRPSRYLGNEVNVVRKDPSTIEVSIALAFPDLYEVGMSHQGLKILYQMLNSHEWLAAERVFSPWVDMEEEMRNRGITLTTLESDRPLADFDIVGFSLQHELSYTNVLNALDLSGIPFLSAYRDNSFPIIIAGGPACFNPEPVADIFDAILIGDGEEAALEICRTVREAKSNKVSKVEILHELKKIKGIYIPSFFKAHYLSEGPVNYIEPLVPDYTHVEKAIVPDIDRYPFPAEQVVPFTQLIHDRLAIEISRGCTRGCRFCQAGMIYRPVRERNPDSIIKNVERALRLTGYEEISLQSLSSGDYSCIAPLIKELMDRHSENKIAVSLPSLRIDSLDPAWFEQIKRVRKTGFTMAPEAGNDRLRKIINKSLTNQEILHVAGKVYEAGWNLIKLYFMIGLPGEGEQDLKDIIDLSRQVSALARGKGKKDVLNVSVSTFVPKAHTPFMWAPLISFEESWRRIRLVRDGLKGRRIRVKWNQPELSWLEGIFSRGDRRLIKPLIEAWRLGARFDAWGELFKMNIWKEAFEKSGMDPEIYLYRSRSIDEVLPWDHIGSGVTKDYHKREWKRAHEEKATPDCREKCLECGVCDHRDIDHLLCEDWSPPSRRVKTSPDPLAAKIRKYRLSFSKMGPAGHLSHLELNRVFIRAFRRAGLNFVFSKGYHPMPKLSFASALPVGTESVHETVDIELYESVPISILEKEIERQLPDGISLSSVEDISLERSRLTLSESHFRITLNGVEIDRTYMDRFLDSDYFPITKKTGKGERTVDVRPLVKSIDYIPPHTLDLVIRHVQGPEIKPKYIIKGIFQLNDHHLDDIKILKTRQVLG